MSRLRGLFGLLLLGVAGGSLAQEKAATKPEKSAIPRGYRVYLVTDSRYDSKDVRNRVGKLHDPVTEHGLFTVLGVWCRSIPTTKDDPLVKVAARVESLANSYEQKKLGAFVAFMVLKKDFEDDDDRYSRMTEISNLSKDWKLLQAGLSEQTSAQNAAWQLDAKNEDMTFKNQITVVLYNRFKVEKRWDFTAEKPPTDADLKEIDDAVEALLGRKPTGKKGGPAKSDDPKVENKTEPKVEPKVEPKPKQPPKEEEEDKKKN